MGWRIINRNKRQEQQFSSSSVHFTGTGLCNPALGGGGGPPGPCQVWVKWCSLNLPCMPTDNQEVYTNRESIKNEHTWLIKRVTDIWMVLRQFALLIWSATKAQTNADNRFQIPFDPGLVPVRTFAQMEYNNFPKFALVRRSEFTKFCSKVSGSRKKWEEMKNASWGLRCDQVGRLVLLVSYPTQALQSHIEIGQLCKNALKAEACTVFSCGMRPVPAVESCGTRKKQQQPDKTNQQERSNAYTNISP